MVGETDSKGVESWEREVLERSRARKRRARAFSGAERSECERAKDKHL